MRAAHEVEIKRLKNDLRKLLDACDGVKEACDDMHEGGSLDYALEDMFDVMEEIRGE